MEKLELVGLTDKANNLTKTIPVIISDETKINANLYGFLETGDLKNIFILGEDPLGCAINN